MNAKTDRELFDRIRQGIAAGVRKAVRERKKAGRSISVWRNGRVERIPPEKIDTED
jgi:hypothetical protein